MEIFKEIKHFHYMNMPKYTKPCPEIHEIYNSGRSPWTQVYDVIDFSFKRNIHQLPISSQNSVFLFSPGPSILTHPIASNSLIKYVCTPLSVQVSPSTSQITKCIQNRTLRLSFIKYTHCAKYSELMSKQRSYVPDSRLFFSFLLFFLFFFFVCVCSTHYDLNNS